ncbi:MAG TPA: glycosyltransferase [Gemmataceae bacterium]|nr:glycosyltransferase [Gemmataceae bacterium]
MIPNTRLLLAGNLGGTNVGDSFFHAAKLMGVPVQIVETRRAFTGPSLWRALHWRLLGHRPPALRTYNRILREVIADFHPTVLLTTGLAPVVEGTIAYAKKAGATVINYLTDDPWNPNHRSRWFFEALPAYDAVFSPRRATLHALRAARCPRVEYLPFAFDPRFAHPVEVPTNEDRPDLMFAGGADRDRVPILGRLISLGFRVALYGDLWERYRETRSAARGHADSLALCRATLAAKVALCLVRRANRDGHVMRSYEAAATGACMLVEDTAEHREMFGEDLETVAYFRDTDHLIARLQDLLSDSSQRSRLAKAVHHRIVSGANTYCDRLATMLHGTGQFVCV